MVTSKRNTWARRSLKLLLPVLIVVDVALVRSGLLDLRGAIIVIIGVEAVIGLSLVTGVTLLVVRRRRKRAAPLDAWSTLEEALEVFLPRPLAKVAVFEPRLFSYLLRWVFRRNWPEEGEFSYHRRSNLWLWPAMALFLTPIELLFFELLVPWAWLRWVLLIAAIYALLWVCGLHASFVLLRHRLEDGGVRLRYGALVDAFVPYSAIAGARQARQQAPDRRDGLRSSPQESAAYVAVNGTTNVALKFREPVALRGVFRATEPVTLVRVFADEPDRFVRALQGRIDGGPRQSDPRGPTNPHLRGRPPTTDAPTPGRD